MSDEIDGLGQPMRFRSGDERAAKVYGLAEIAADLAMSEAFSEFRAAARAAHTAQLAAQETAKRYAAAVKRLSELAVAEPT